MYDKIWVERGGEKGGVNSSASSVVSQHFKTEALEILQGFHMYTYVHAVP